MKMFLSVEGGSYGNPLEFEGIILDPHGRIEE
jgi:hypothetical protein